jgi:hypothetical protein
LPDLGTLQALERFVVLKHSMLAVDTAQGSSASRLGQLTVVRVFMISLSSSKQMPVDYLKLGQDYCLQNRLQFAKHFAI